MRRRVAREEDGDLLALTRQAAQRAVLGRLDLGRWLGSERLLEAEHGRADRGPEVRHRQEWMPMLGRYGGFGGAPGRSHVFLGLWQSAPFDRELLGRRLLRAHLPDLERGQEAVAGREDPRLAHHGALGLQGQVG